MSFDSNAVCSEKSSLIVAKGIHKTYGPVRALQDVDFAMEKKGKIIGLLGSNGAGKTTLMEILVGLRQADKGSVRVLGFDPMHQCSELLQQVGIQTQSFAVQSKLTPVEVLTFFASLYPNPLDVHITLKELELKDKANNDEILRKNKFNCINLLRIVYIVIYQPFEQLTKIGGGVDW